MKCIRKLVQTAISRRSGQEKGREEKDMETGEGVLKHYLHTAGSGPTAPWKMCWGKIRICVRPGVENSSIRKFKVVGYEAPATKILRASHRSMHATTADRPHATHGRLSVSKNAENLQISQPPANGTMAQSSPAKTDDGAQHRCTESERRGRRKAEDSNCTCRSRRCKRTRRRRKACAWCP